ncbi:crossover junction endodeoxyribonuclease RuvC [Patescibacteria group bacterium]|nr:crossover junction endodeoxyribonuclease RuvC [Patescibacteria group bacterium]
MRVLAIDPGFDRLGVAIIDRVAGKETLVFSTCLTSTRGTPLPERLGMLGNELSTIIKAHEPTDLAIETLFFNKNVKTAIDVAQARGMVLYLGQSNGCLVHEYSPQQVKVAVTGYGASDKTAVFSMVKRLIANAPEKAHDDEYDAIAVGITCLAHLASGR